MAVIPAISQSQSRPPNTAGSDSTVMLIGGLVGVLLGLTCCMCMTFVCRVLKNYRNNHQRTRVEPRVRALTVTYQNGAAAPTLPQQQPLAFSIPTVPQTSALRPVNTNSDTIAETVDDISLSNKPPPSYYEVQAQETALPSYTEVIQENRLQESVNVASSSEVNAAQETIQQHPNAGAEASHETQYNTHEQ